MAKLHLFLVVLLLANNSFAVESFAHNLHQHDQLAEIVQPAMHHGHDAADQHGVDQAAASEDCICDDVCCVSTAQMQTQSAIPEESYHQDAIDPVPSFYQSIFLELTQPPPTS